MKTKNQENIPQDEPIILCANHLNIWDAVGIVMFTKKPIRFIAKYEVFENRFANWLLHLFDAIPIKRGQRDLESMKTSIKSLKDGESLGIFPEGTRKGLAKGAKVQNGAAYMAMKTNTKVVPVGIQGSFKPFTKVTLNYGKPLDFSKYDTKTPEKENLEQATKEIMDNIIMLTKVEN
jgi:1-acyl-sn-glycerol-3-phosphate acyltransferase